MKTELHNYDIYPKVFLVRIPVTITIKPLGKHVVFSGTEEFILISMAHGSVNDYPTRHNYKKMDVEIGEDGCARFTWTFEEECEYLIRLILF